MLYHNKFHNNFKEKDCKRQIILIEGSHFEDCERERDSEAVLDADTHTYTLFVGAPDSLGS